MSPLTNVSELWHPTPDYVQRSRLLRFMQRHRIADYPALYDRSIGEMEWFWKAALEEMGIEWAFPYTRVLDLSKGIQWPQWFVGGRLNLVHNCVDKYRTGPRAAHLAIRWEGEDSTQRSLTYRQLDTEVCRAAAILGRLGVRRGDRVAVFLPMLPEVAIITLACSKLGATYTPIFSGLGAEAVAARVQDCEATLLVTADGFSRRGGLVKMKQVGDEAAARCPTIKHLLVVQRAGCSISWQAGRDVWWHEVMPGEGEGPATEVRTEVMAADEPFMIIYTSGTTGRPKGTVHVHSGFPIKAAQDLAFHFDLQSDDTLFWFTDMGWMMGPWEIMGALTLGATCLLYEGVPDWPHPGRLWEVVARHHVTILGLSPTAVRALMRHGDAPVYQHDLTSLRVLGSTGEPWTPDAYLWYFQHVGQGRCPIINYSGGTEVSGGIVGGTVLQPCKPCAFTGPCLGPAEVEAILTGHPAVSEAAAIGVPHPVKGEALVCFVVLRHGWTPSEALSSELAGRVGEQLGKPLRPAAVHVVPELPKTRNAKILRRVIRAAFVGQDPGDLSSLENPQAVVAIKQLR